MEFRLPELGEGVYEAELIRWLVRPGDAVRRGQNLVEVMTDKATMEVPAPFAGVVTATIAAPGHQIKIGDVVLTYTPVSAEDRAEPPGSLDEPETLDPEIAALLEPPHGELPPAERPLPHPRNGVRNAPPAPPRVPDPPDAPVKAGPAVRQLARKLGVDLSRIKGSGPHGRILLEDLTLPNSSGGPAGPGGPPAEPKPGNGAREDRLPKFDLGRPGTRVRMHGLRRKTAEHMALSKKTIPHYSYVDECDVTDLVRLRGSLRGAFGKAGLKLTYLAFIVRAVALALRDVPLVNSSLDEAAGEIVVHDRCHVGIAVATAQGLIVPVIRDADRKDVQTLAAEIERLSSDARDGRARLDDLRGGTFTVSSIGSIGGLISAPIINHPEVGILAVGKIVKRPAFDEHGAVRAAQLVYLSFSFDHRVVDGAVGAMFGNAIVRRLQEPAALLLREPLLP